MSIRADGPPALQLLLRAHRRRDHVALARRGLSPAARRLPASHPVWAWRRLAHRVQRSAALVLQGGGGAPCFGKRGGAEQLGLWFTPGYSYPQGIVAQSYLDKQLSTLLGDLQFDGNPVQVYSLPQARNSTDPTQQRPACQGNTSCIPICPIQAKWDATVFLDQAADSAEIRYQTVVTRLHLHPATKAVASLDFVQYDKPAHGTTTTGSVRAKGHPGSPRHREPEGSQDVGHGGVRGGAGQQQRRSGTIPHGPSAPAELGADQGPCLFTPGPPGELGHRGACETVPSGRSAEASAWTSATRGGTGPTTSPTPAPSIWPSPTTARPGCWATSCARRSTIDSSGSSGSDSWWSRSLCPRTG